MVIATSPPVRIGRYNSILLGVRIPLDYEGIIVMRQVQRVIPPQLRERLPLLRGWDSFPTLSTIPILEQQEGEPSMECEQVAQNKWSIYQLDVKLAFLNVILK